MGCRRGRRVPVTVAGRGVPFRQRAVGGAADCPRNRVVVAWLKMFCASKRSLNQATTRPTMDGGAGARRRLRGREAVPQAVRPEGDDGVPSVGGSWPGRVEPSGCQASVIMAGSERATVSAALFDQRVRACGRCACAVGWALSLVFAVQGSVGAAGSTGLAERGCCAAWWVISVIMSSSMVSPLNADEVMPSCRAARMRRAKE